jgi:hypothetical protein
MFDQMFDTFRKASESALQMQQEMLKNWTQQWMAAPTKATSGSADWGRTFQKRWVELGVELLNKHREALDSTYRTGIDVIEQSFRTSEARSPDEYRAMLEDLWRKLFETFKAQAESQFHDFQTWSTKSAEIVQDARS